MAGSAVRRYDVCDSKLEEEMETDLQQQHDRLPRPEETRFGAKRIFSWMHISSVRRSTSVKHGGYFQGIISVLELHADAFW